MADYNCQSCGIPKMYMGICHTCARKRLDLDKGEVIYKLDDESLQAIRDIVREEKGKGDLSSIREELLSSNDVVHSTHERLLILTNAVGMILNYLENKP